MASVRKVETGNGLRFRGRVYAGVDPETGKRRILVKTFTLKKAAEAWARKVEQQKESGEVVVASKEPLSAYLTRWLDATMKGRVRARTWESYRALLHSYIIEPPEGAPQLGAVRLDRLRSDHVEELYSWLWTERGLSPRTLRYLHTVLRGALKHAVKKRERATNPTDHVKPPSQVAKGGGVPEKRMRTMTREEAASFLKAADSDRYAALWTVLLLGGLRPGEAFALTWADVDLDGGRLHVQRSLTRRGAPKPCTCGHDRKGHAEKGRGACQQSGCECARFESAGGWLVTDPKTAQSRRVVTLPKLAVARLRAHRARQAKERLQLGAEYHDNGFVFTTTFGAPLDASNLSRHFARVCAGAELGTWEERPARGTRGPKPRPRFRAAFRVYDLRHTCATLLLLAGENPKVVSERLGHASITLTLDTYSHVLPAMQEQSARKLDAMFASP